jgi:hypothetical protein
MAVEIGKATAPLILITLWAKAILPGPSFETIHIHKYIQFTESLSCLGSRAVPKHHQEVPQVTIVPFLEVSAQMLPTEM